METTAVFVPSGDQAATLIDGRVVRQLHRVGPVDVHDEDLVVPVAVRLEHDPRAVRGQRRVGVDGRVRREPHGARPVGSHRVDLLLVGVVRAVTGRGEHERCLHQEVGRGFRISPAEAHPARAGRVSVIDRPGPPVVAPGSGQPRHGNAGDRSARHRWARDQLAAVEGRADRLDFDLETDVVAVRDRKPPLSAPPSCRRSCHRPGWRWCRSPRLPETGRVVRQTVRGDDPIEQIRGAGALARDILAGGSREDRGPA